MSQAPVKWVDANSLKDNAGKCDCDVGSTGPVPVIELSALREWLKKMESAIRHLEQKDHNTKTWCDGCSEAKRLLASLGEVAELSQVKAKPGA